MGRLGFLAGWSPCKKVTSEKEVFWMDLGLNYEDGDFVASKVRRGQEKAKAYVPKNCQFEWFVGDEAESKHNADLAYFNGEYDKAAELYRKVLDRDQGKARGVFQTATKTDELARALLRAGRIEEAEEWADKLLASANPSNVDALVVGFDILRRIHSARKDPLGEAKCLASIIDTHHSILPGLWSDLGDAYARLSDSSTAAKEQLPVSDQVGPLRVALGCYLRALALLKTVEATVLTFAKTSNTLEQADLEAKIEQLASDQIGFDRAQVQAQMIRDITGGAAHSPVETEQDFQDLESLAKRKLKVMEDLETTKEDNQESKFVSMTAFENKWFGFMLKNF